MTSWKGLYKLRTRESEKLKTVLELCNMEIHQKKAGPDDHRLKAMVKRSIEQDIRNKNFGTRIGNYEKKRRGHESGNKTAWTKNSWRLLAMENQRAVFQRRHNCSFRHDVKKRAKMTQTNPSPSSFMQQNERNASRTRSPRGKKSQWKNGSMALQGLPQRNLHQFIL